METTVVDKVIVDLTHVGDEIRVTQRQIPFQQGDVVRLRANTLGSYNKSDLCTKPPSSKRDYIVVDDCFFRILIKIKTNNYVWIDKDSVLTHKTQLSIRYED